MPALRRSGARARELAEHLSAINAERRELQSDMVEQAEAGTQVDNAAWREALPVGVVLFEPDWHHGVVGLVASKLKEMLQSPGDRVRAGGRGQR